MQNLRLAAALMVVLVAAVGQAQAGMIVDTGTPDSTRNWSFRSSQYFAGEFSTSTSCLVNGIEGYFATWLSSGDVLFAIHADAGNVPGQVLYSSSAAYSGTNPLGWHGVSGLDWSLSPGTYWVSFRPTGSLLGVMPGHAPNPLSEYGQGYGDYVWDDWGADYFDDLDLGVRIDGTATDAVVPEPSTFVSVLSLGTIGLLIAWRRRRATQSSGHE